MCTHACREMPDLVVKAGTQLGAAPADDGEEAGEHAEMSRRIVDLLVEMVECADVVLLNKADRLAQADMAALDGIVRQFNPSATVHQCRFGKVLALDCSVQHRPCKNGLQTHSYGHTHVHARCLDVCGTAMCPSYACVCIHV
jgi:G3E family GTPase